MTGGRLSSLAGSIVRAARRPRVALIGAGLIAVLIMAVYGAADSPRQSASTAPASPQAISVETAVAARGDVPVFFEGLGTVQAFYTVTISPRVDGQLMKLGFVEGQMVKPGDLLAQIDPRPFQAALDQAIATKAKDVAQLANARRDLERYITLAPEEFTSEQTLETQRALVAQLEAQVVGDQAMIDNARTQLDYTTIRSPIQGRTGIRLTDPGNIVHAATATGIVVVTQMQPISVIFTLPADGLSAVRTAMALAPLQVTAISRDGKNPLGSGTVGLIDNEIDQTTGTMRLKATFPNQDGRLWPGDFVNARVLLQTRRNALTIPSTAVQRGPDGVYAYVVKPDSTVEMRPLQVAEESAGITVIEKGLQDGERVTTSNQYRLQPGTRVQVVQASAASPAVAGKAAP
ncbi:MAG TPA: efflux RND transporter periplasmic adaptor subunit [Burkholderiaceae bacterium]|jgi:multidrug efflux system membrane fusion protein|nr:efflux RND transporter periplasmic adaptor subunit [Burkholderiaceae bacterium]